MLRVHLSLVGSCHNINSCHSPMLSIFSLSIFSLPLNRLLWYHFLIIGMLIVKFTCIALIIYGLFFALLMCLMFCKLSKCLTKINGHEKVLTVLEYRLLLQLYIVCLLKDYTNSVFNIQSQCHQLASNHTAQFQQH